ncbi:hypothetical protein H4R19_003399, partial [Coemansia spiralis]
MFTTPSVRARHRAALQHTRAGATSTDDLAASRPTLKRGLSTAGESASAGALGAAARKQARSAADTQAPGARQQPHEASARPSGPAGDAAPGERVLLCGDKHTVVEVAALPDAAWRQVAAASARGLPLAAGLSSAGPFAFVATPTECGVWAYGHSGVTGRVHRLETAASSDEAPIVALAAVGDASDVGALVCTPSGQLRYWDRVAFGLGGTERFRSGAIALGDTGDRCAQATEVLQGLLVVATAQGRLFRVVLDDSTELDPQPLGRGTYGGVLGRVSSLLGATGDTADGVLVGIACGSRADLRHSRELLVLTRTRLSKWVVSRSQAERREYSMDIVRALTLAAGGSESVRVLDVAATHAGDACVLAATRRGGREQLAVALLRSGRASEPDVIGMWPFSCVPADGVPAQARLVLPDGGPALLVVLRTTVVAAVVTAAGIAFEAQVTLSAETPVLAQGAMSGAGTLLCAGAGVLRVSVDVARVLGAAPQAQPSAERECQTQLEQAVFFDCAGSPLAFPLMPQGTSSNGTLETAALR